MGWFPPTPNILSPIPYMQANLINCYLFFFFPGDEDVGGPHRV